MADTLKAIISKLLPGAYVDGAMQDSAPRFNRYGSMFVVEEPQTRHVLASEGTYFVAVNPTVGTGMTQVAAQTAFSDTAPNLYIANNEAAGGKEIMIDYIKMVTTAAATASTAIHYAAVVDNQIRAPTTDNTAALTVGRAASGGVSAQVTVPTVKWQNSTTASAVPASSSQKCVVGRGVLGGLNIAADELFIAFGVTNVGAHTATTAAEGAGQPGRRVSCSGPAVIPPQGSFVLHLWAPSSSASFNPEVEIGFWMR